MEDGATIADLSRRLIIEPEAQEAAEHVRIFLMLDRGYETD
jgi:hypothetical protein